MSAAGLESIAKALLKSHCAGHENGLAPGHECAGSCTITREGVTLSCKLCGNGEEPNGPRAEFYAAAERVLDAVGVRLSLFSAEARQRAAEEMETIVASVRSNSFGRS